MSNNNCKIGNTANVEFSAVRKARCWNLFTQGNSFKFVLKIVKSNFRRCKLKMQCQEVFFKTRKKLNQYGILF